MIDLDKIYVATIAPDCKKVIDKYGVGVELDQFCMAENMYEEKYINILKELTDNGYLDVKNKVLHAPFSELSPASIDPSVLENAYKRIYRACEICENLGIKRMVVHSGYIPRIYFHCWHLERSIEFWSNVIKKIPDDMVICVENVMDEKPEMLVDLVKGVNSPKLLATLDTGHALCASDIDPVTWVKVLGPYIGHYHLHENDGVDDLHQAIGQGVMDREGVFEAIKGFGRDDATYTIESRDSETTMKWIIENLRLTTKL
ncbi:MAG: sugar phosphate isomerase/epimerase family protein [Anaerovoracaceae bacterium]